MMVAAVQTLETLLLLTAGLKSTLLHHCSLCFLHFSPLRTTTFGTLKKKKNAFHSWLERLENCMTAVHHLFWLCSSECLLSDRLLTRSTDLIVFWYVWYVNGELYFFQWRSTFSLVNCLQWQKLSWLYTCNITEFAFGGDGSKMSSRNPMRFN